VDFTSSITLKFNDLFSSGFSQARESLTGLKSSLNGINGSGLKDIAPPSFTDGGIELPAPIVPAPQFSGMDELEEMLGGSAAHLDGLSDSLNGIGAGLNSATPKAGIFDAGLAQIQSGLDKIGQNNSLNMVAAQLSTMAYMTAPLQNALSNMMAEPSRLAGNFESSMKNIQAITGLTTDEIKNLGNELLSIGSRFGAGPQAVADAYNDVAGGITKVEAQMPVLNNALALAEAGQADLGVAANGLVKIMNSYNFTTGEAADISEKAAWASDVMTQAVGMGVGSMQEFISAVAPISGMASSVGVGFDEIGSTMAYMTATTDTANTAGTKLQSFMVALQKPSDALATALESVGITSGSAMLSQYGLAESANIVLQAFDGNQDAMTAAMGRVEAMQAVVSLTGSTYTEFAAEFGSAMDGITAKSQAIQTQAYESKMARFQAATDTLKIQVGDDINSIKGFFVDMGTGFLTSVVSPIMNSPVGGVFQGIAAGAGIAAQGILSMGSGALNTAAQLSVLAANVKNLGGYAEMLKGTLSVMGAPFRSLGSGVLSLGRSIIGALPALGGWIASMWSAAAATIAATWPILAVIVGVAALAAGVYLIIKNWDAVSAFFINLWNKIAGAFQIAWEWIKAFFASLWNSLQEPVMAFANWIGRIWNSIVSVFTTAWNYVSNFFSAVWSGMANIVSSVANWFGGVWTAIISAFTTAWGYVSTFFSNLWNGMANVVLIAANWFGGVWAAITGAFSAAWNFVGGLFTSIWENIKGVVMGFVDWMTPIIDVILAPFRAIGDAIGWIFDKVGLSVKAGNEAAAAKRSSLAQAAAPSMQTTSSAASGQSLARATPAPPAVTQTAISAPALAATATTAPAFTATSIGAQTPALPGAVSVGAAPEFSGAASAPIPVSQMAAPSPASDTLASLATATRTSAPELTHTASGAFASAISATPAIAPSIDMSALERQVDMRLQEAPLPEARALASPWQQTAPQTQEPSGPKTVTIQNLTVQAEDMRNALDFIRVLMNAVHQPEAAAV
jgi:TP901 family phage tail tape measure protein